MQKQIFRGLKWFIFSSCFVIGVASMRNIETGGMKWAAVAACAFGTMYVMSNIWKSLNSKTMLFTIFLIASCWFCAQYVPDLYYIATGNQMDMGYNARWILLLFFPGTPIILYALRKYN